MEKNDEAAKKEALNKDLELAKQKELLRLGNLDLETARKREEDKSEKHVKEMEK